MNSAAERGLYRWEWASVLLLLPLFLAFGWNVVQRSAYFDTRMTDYGVYTRSAWAVHSVSDRLEELMLMPTQRASRLVR